MIDWVTIQGFRSVRNVEQLRLGPINALVGANGSGKSNLFHALGLLRAICRGNLQHYVLQSGGAERLLHFDVPETERITIGISFTQPAARYQIELTPGDGDALLVRSEQVFPAGPPDSNPSRNQPACPEGRDSRESALFALPAAVRPASVDRLRVHLKDLNIYHFHNAGPLAPLRKTNQLHDNRALRPDGSNLAAFLYLLRTKHESSCRLIRRTIRLIAPFFKDFALEPEAPNEETLRFRWKAEGSDDVFGAAALSDASLRFIALTTLLLQPEEIRPPVIVMDEPELGLHPAAITLLGALIRQASVRTQIMFATQSPQLLDNFLPENVLVADRVNGSTHFTSCADDAERLLPWLEDYSLGQLWGMNEIGGRPVPENVPPGVLG